MSYEQSPASDSYSDPTLSTLSYTSGELTKNDSNNPSYVTENCLYEFGKPDNQKQNYLLLKLQKAIW